MNSDMKQTATELMDYLKKAVSPYHTVEAGKEKLLECGFTELPIKGKWNVAEGGRYFVVPFKTSLFAFTVGEQPEAFHIAAAHTDFPCLHVKPKAELASRGYMRVNTEIYGGPILNTWLDRPLSMAGRVTLRSEDVYHPGQVLVDFKRPVLTIPNLAVHYNREVNKGVELTKQNDMLPLLGILNEKLNEKEYFIDFLARELGRSKEDILDFDLFVYNTEEPALIGMNEELVSSPRLDNVTSCHALVKAIAEAAPCKGRINVIALFDNEEIGSNTKQGADAALLPRMLEKLYGALGKENCDFGDAVLDSFLLSVDVAHALHPARGDKYDPVNCMLMNEGVTMKLSANQRYTYDTEAVAILQQLCEKNGIKYKKFVNHADMPGGATLGPMISSWLPMKTVDIGVPILAMHSARELMGAEDQDALNRLVRVFFDHA